MILKYDHLLGRQFVHGRTDCYTLVQDFYRDNLGLELPNVARPDGWWDKDMDLYMDHLWEQGFYVLQNPRPTDLQPCDGFLCAILSKKANHAAVYVGDGHIIHHYWGRLSNKELYKGIWKNTTVAIVRHETMRNYKPPKEQVNLLEDPRIAWKLRNAQAS